MGKYYNMNIYKYQVCRNNWIIYEKIHTTYNDIKLIEYPYWLGYCGKTIKISENENLILECPAKHIRNGNICFCDNNEDIEILWS